MDTLTISELIKKMQDLKKKCGDASVFLSSDEEGNMLGSLNARLSFGWDNENKYVVLYPFEQEPNL